MTKTRRLVATLIATAALAVPSAAVSTAAAAESPAGASQSDQTDKAKKAKKAKSTKAHKPQTKQLLKAVAVRDKRLARLSTSTAVERLADDTETELVANITDARTELAGIKSAAEAADSTMDTRAARKELRSFRVQNFRLVVNILKQAEGLTEASAADPEATAHLAEAETAALAITATSSKSDVKAARAHLKAARAELEETETEPTDSEPAPVV